MTADILRELADAARIRVKDAKEKVPMEEMVRRASSMPALSGFPFEKSLSKDGIGFICECKKASPSKGVIAAEFPYLEIAKEYEAAGASAISVLTEPTRFLGEDRFLKEISETVRIPCLRKDFTVDEYMIYEARTLGASAVLLICSLLDRDELERYIGIAHELGMSALCETRDASEIRMALDAGARVIGVNNRDLRDFTVDLNKCIELRPLVPDNVLFVAESGISSREDIERLENAGVDAVLIGESLMRSSDRRKALDGLRGIQ
ncbi:MAG: indole-3-glycerol phosphate synthase TrpC [Candidatus Methanomethylophilaceae archaeon]|nr:indole-3-glycerol phosphate synthase TrpC [Candidatus Methanomethylophilaceae archaeon]MBP5394810.1 indole-3-glycerol phosphate synthase TrpC [Candidatus Methanomethylophilaceae archaeon]